MAISRAPSTECELHPPTSHTWIDRVFFTSVGELAWSILNRYFRVFHILKHSLHFFLLCRPNNDVVLNTIKSPVLEREGFVANEFEKAGLPVPKMSDFVVAKQTWQQAKNRIIEDAEILPGFTTKLFA